MGTIPALNDCDPGIRPTGFNVLVALPGKEEKIGSIIIPPNISDRERMVQVEGRLVACSPAAFDFARWPNDDMPKPGDAVMFAKLAGIVVSGRDGHEYRLLDDKSITAVVEEAA